MQANEFDVSMTGLGLRHRRGAHRFFRISLVLFELVVEALGFHIRIHGEATIELFVKQLEQVCS